MASLGFAGCAASPPIERRIVPVEARAATRPSPSASRPSLTRGLSPELRRFRDYVSQAAPGRLDSNYTVFASALPDRVADVDYYEFVRQMSDADPDTRANGICGVAAARRPASLDHLLRVVKTETDPFNRTMLVWCLRLYAADPRVAPALEAFIDDAPDLDFQRAIGPGGRIIYITFPPPFAGAAYEAYKALLAIRGREHMIAGPGWERFADRFERHVNPQPVRAVDLSRFRSHRPRVDPHRRADEWIDDLRRPR